MTTDWSPEAADHVTHSTLNICLSDKCLSLKYRIHLLCVCVFLETPLTIAVIFLTQPLSVMMTLVEGGARLDYRNRIGLTAMHRAAQTGQKDSIKVLTYVTAINFTVKARDQLRPEFRPRNPLKELLIDHFKFDISLRGF